MLDRFCAAFAAKDVDAVMGVFADSDDIAVVTSEEPLLRGREELRSFTERYAAGDTTYSWIWQRCEALVEGTVGWLLAEGTEMASTPDGEARHPYRMTMVMRNAGDRWLIVQAHGSSPHSS